MGYIITSGLIHSSYDVLLIIIFVNAFTSLGGTAW